MGRAPLVALLMLVSCTGPSAQAVGPVSTASVDLPRSYLFAPTDITVSAGTTITWTNNDQFTHSVQVLEGPASVGTNLVMKPGEKVTLKLDAPGLYRYVCSFHPQNMKGTVTVTAK